MQYLMGLIVFTSTYKLAVLIIKVGLKNIQTVIAKWSCLFRDYLGDNYLPIEL